MKNFQNLWATRNRVAYIFVSDFIFINKHACLYLQQNLIGMSTTAIPIPFKKLSEGIKMKILKIFYSVLVSSFIFPFSTYPFIYKILSSVFIYM